MNHVFSATEAPFGRTVSFGDVAERVEAVVLGTEPEEMRRQFARLMGAPSKEREWACAAGQMGSVEGLMLYPAHREAAGVARVVWFHGGGYVFGSPETHVRPAGRLAVQLGEAVFVPRYRLAPEALWPAPLEDALAIATAAAAVQENGRYALAGDSAGGHLALATAFAMIRQQQPPAALALFSPNTDRTGQSRTRVAHTPTDPMNSDEDDRRLAHLVFDGSGAPEWQRSPLLDRLGLLPPTHVEVGGREVLLDDARLLARQGTAAGADVALHVTPEAFHMWQLWTPWLAEADASLGRAAAFLRRHLRSGA